MKKKVLFFWKFACSILPGARSWFGRDADCQPFFDSLSPFPPSVKTPLGLNPPPIPPSVSKLPPRSRYRKHWAKTKKIIKKIFSEISERILETKISAVFEISKNYYFGKLLHVVQVYTREKTYYWPNKNYLPRELKQPWNAVFK